LKKLNLKEDGSVELENASSYINKEKIYNSLPYIISDSENSLAAINEYYFALASVTSYESRHLLITVFNIFNDDNTINANYFDVPIKDLYDINYYGNLQAFGYKNTFGVQFDHKKGEEYRSGFIIFGYGNSTDPTPVENLFTKKDSYIIRPYDYITIENNVFCYTLVNIVITKLPDASTGVIVLRNSNKQVLKVGDIISLKDELNITYTGNKDDIPRGKYIVGFTPYLNEPDEDDYYECLTDIEMIGQEVPTYWRPDEYYGRTSHFTFTVGDCYENCKTCVTKGSDINNQECETCKENYYFIEGTKNCVDNPPDGYYFDEDKKIFTKCYEKCKKCSKMKNGNIHNCLACYTNNLLYNSTNCLDCKFNNKFVNYEQTDCIDEVPSGFYVNDTNKNTIDKCHERCLTCKNGPKDDNMNCIVCNNDKGYYLVENTNNCEEYPLPGYYLEDNIFKKCNKSCATCSAKATFNYQGKVANCDTCNKDLGFYPDEEEPKTCSNDADEGKYFDEDCKCYRKCYTNCLTCSARQIDEKHMNCLSCKKSQGFTFFPKTKNCLNCKSLNKYVNYEQTECIDQVPKGYYVNDTSINTIDKCYKDCETCSGGISINSMNCKTCQPSLYLVDGNCVKIYTCPNKFFYQSMIDKNADPFQKICLKQNEECPCLAPFYYTHSNECVESCPLELLLYQGCKISNLPYGLNKIINIVKLYFSQGMIDTLSKSFSLTNYMNLYSIAAQLSVYSLFSTNIFFRDLETTEFQSLTDDNVTFINENNFKETEINLGDCEKKLKKYYNIPDDNKLTIIKLDFKKNDSSINNVQYEVFNSKNRSQRLDLSICNEEKIIVKNQLDPKLSVNKVAIILNNSQYNSFDSEDEIYNNECVVFTSEEKTDVVPKDRFDDYYFKNKICQNGCELKDLDITSGKASCSCPPNKGFSNIEFSDVEKLLDDDDNTNNNNNIVKYQEYSSINGKMAKCAKNIFSGYFIKNYILIIFTLLLIGYIAIFVFYLVSKDNIWSIAFCDDPKENKKEEMTEKVVREVKIKNSNDINDIETNKNAGTSDRMTKKPPKNIIEKLRKDIDEYKFEDAKEKDKRPLIKMFISSIIKREIFTFSFIKDLNIAIIKKALLIFAFINYFAVNTFFFNEKNIHQIYVDKGKYNSGYQFKYVILSVLLSSLFLYIAKYLSTTKGNYSKEVANSLEFKIWILFGATIPLFIFYWVYIGGVTSVYINSNNHLFINIILTVVFYAIFECLLAAISASLRYFGLKNNKSILYDLSRIINHL